MTRIWLAALATTCLLGQASCTKNEIWPAPQPPRPKELPAPDKRPDTGPAPVAMDCPAPKPGDAVEQMPPEKRQTATSESFYNDGDAKLKEAATPGIGKPAYEQAMTDAIDALITALSYDPYNVDATYALAGAYARIERPQCSLNLLERLVQMRPHGSKKSKVEAKLDFMLGRNKERKRDPAFEILWDDDRFMKLVSNICRENEPNCSYGK